MLNIFIGWDSRETVAYHVLAHSIIRRASIPITIFPLSLTSVAGIYKRNRGPTESTEFALTRFLVPYLMNYRGMAVFMDCDMIFQADIAELVRDINKVPFKPVYVCKHSYRSKVSQKFLGQKQTNYPRKNWSSLMVFNSQHFTAQRLTPEYVNKTSGLDLHRFAWLDDREIGALGLEWNWLVGEYQPNSKAKVLHYTLGGPWFEEYKDCGNADLWFREKNDMETESFTDSDQEKAVG